MIDSKQEPWFDDFGDTACATNVQVGGNHYTKQGIQPLESTYRNFGYEGLKASIYTKVNKYLTRDKGTHRQDLQKAIHVLQIQMEYYDRWEDLEALKPRNTTQPIEGNK